MILKQTFDEIFLFVPRIIPDDQTQIVFFDSIKNNFTSSFDSWGTDRKAVDTQLKYQVDNGRAQNFNSPKCLIVAHQTADRIGIPNRANKIAVFCNLNVRKYHIDIDGVKHPRNAIIID